MADMTEIILAAVNSVEPKTADESDAAYERRVRDQAANLTTMMGERSTIARHLEILEECKVFRAEVVGIKKEKSSTRGLVTLKTVNKDGDEQEEEARTDRTNNDPDSDGSAMARKLQKELTGHNVLVWIYLEPMGKDRKVRVIKHVKDLGPAN